MRINGWSIKAFGPIEEWSISGLSGNNIVIILGPNESGKSALFEFFTSAMFGWAPARADRHPYRPWDGQYPEGRLEVVLREGGQALLIRRLTSQPQGQITTDGRSEALANRRVDWVGSMDRNVFKNVYALTQEEALGLGKQGWQVVQDLLGGSSFDFIRPSREVIQTLDDDRRRLWRPNRRGRPAYREISDEIRGLRASLAEATDQRRRIQEANGRLLEISSALDENTTELQRIELKLERDQTLAPLVRQVDRLRSFETQVADLVPDNDALEIDVAEREELGQRLIELRRTRAKIKRLITERGDAREIEAVTRQLLAARTDIERLDRELSRALDHQERIRSMDAELQRSDGALRELAGRALTSELLDEAANAALGEISVVELRGRFAVWTEARQRLVGVQGHLRQIHAEQDKTEDAIAKHEAAQRIEADTRELLDARSEIERLDRESSRALDHRDRIGNLDAELQRSEGALRQLAGRTLTTDETDDAIRSAILHLSVPEVRGRFTAWQDARQRLQAAEDRASDLEKQKRETGQAIEERETTLEVDESTRSLVDAQADIERLDRELSRTQANQDRFLSLATEMERIEDVFSELAGRTLSSDQLRDRVRDAILGISIAEMRGRLATWRMARQQQDAVAVELHTARSERDRLERALATEATEQSRMELDKRLSNLRQLDRVRSQSQESSSPLGSLSLSLTVMVGILGVLVFAFGVAAGTPIGLLAAIFVVAVLVALGATITNRKASRSPKQQGSHDWQAGLRGLGLEPHVDLDAEIERTQLNRDAALRLEDIAERLESARAIEDEASRRLQANKATTQSALNEVHSVVAGLPIAPIQRANPDEGLVRDIEEMRRTLRSAQRVRRDRDEVAGRLADWSDEVAELGSALQTGLPADSFEAVLAARRELADALEVKRAAETAAIEVRKLRQQLAETSEAIEVARTDCQRLESETSNARERFHAAVSGIPVASMTFESSDEGLIRDLEVMRETVDSLQRLRESRENLSSQLSEWRTAVGNLRQTLRAEMPEDPFHAVTAVRRALSDALEVERVAKSAAAEIPELRRQLEAGREALSDAQEIHREVSSSLRAAHDGFLEVIAEVPVTPIHRESPSADLVQDLEDLRKALLSLQRLRDNRRDVALRFEEWCGEVGRLQKILEIELPSDPFEAAPAARRALQSALEAERRARVAEAEIPELRERLEVCNQDLDSVQLRLEQIDASLAAIDPDSADPRVGLERLQRAIVLRDEARHALLQLERETPDWRERLAEAEQIEANGDRVGLSDDERVASRRRANVLLQIGQDLADERGRRTNERDRWMEEPGPAHITGAIEDARERQEAVQREHDRLALLRTVVSLAEESYRERFQSPLLSAAGGHLRRFTGGRYDLLDVDDASSGEVKLQVRRTGEDDYENVDTPLSRGTIQQIYFALRLAMVDLVEGDEPLPLFLDEMFVNWDPGRTTSGLAALANMPGDRQVFLFTADPFWAERAVQDVPAHIVRTPAA